MKLADTRHQDFDEWADELDTEFKAYAGILVSNKLTPCSLEVILHAAKTEGVQPADLLRGRRAARRP